MPAPHIEANVGANIGSNQSCIVFSTKYQRNWRQNYVTDHILAVQCAGYYSVYTDF